MTYSIAWALFALGLILVGMRIKQRAARYAGVALLGMTLAKLFLHDLSDLERALPDRRFRERGAYSDRGLFHLSALSRASEPDDGSHFLLSQIARRCSSCPCRRRRQTRQHQGDDHRWASPVICSRVLGLIREMVIAALFGASRNMDAFLTAFRAPNMLRDLFAEGALSTAFVTTFSRRIATEGDQSAWRLASKVATLTLVFMSAITLLGILFAPFVIGYSCPRFSGGKGGSHDPAHADHVSVHSPRFARRARHGNAERERCLRHSGAGFELL